MPFTSCTCSKINQQKLTNNHSLTYHVSVVISIVRYRFQNIGRLHDSLCKNCYLHLTMGLSSEKEKYPKSRKIFSFNILSGSPPHRCCRKLWVSCLLITLDGMFLRDCCNYISSFVSDSLWDFWWKWFNACCCADPYTACCRSTEYRLW